MKKVIPALTILLALLSTLILTQCTPKEPEKRPETREEMLADIEKNYKLKEENDWVIFYFKEINSIRTNDFYSIDKNNGSIYKSPFLITKEEAVQLKKILDGHPEYLERTFDLPQTYQGNSNWKPVKTEEKITIVKYEGKLFPMKWIDVEYKSSDSEYSNWETYYFNLLDGSSVDYDPTKTD